MVINDRIYEKVNVRNIIFTKMNVRNIIYWHKTNEKVSHGRLNEYELFNK